MRVGLSDGVERDAELVRALTKRLWWRSVVALFPSAALFLGFLEPLLGSAGWELSAIFSVPAALFGGFSGIAIVRLAREAGAAVHPVRIWLLSLVVSLVPLCFAFLVAFAHALRGPVSNCTPGASIAFFALMPLSSAAFSAAAGVVFARGLRGHRIAGVLFAALVAGSLLRTLAGVIDGPAIFFGNHFFGWFPGPLYDEALRVDAPLLYLRLLSLLISLAGLQASALFPDQGPSAGRAPDNMPPLLFAGDRLRDGALLGLLVLALAVAAGFRRDFRIDLRRSDVQAALGGHVRTEHFDIWFDAGTKPERVKLLAQDHEFRWHLVTSWMGVTPTRRVTSYVFPDEGSKKRLTGAGSTQIARPNRGEIYLNGSLYPHPVLEHELAHVVSAEFGSRWLGGVTLKIGLLEGVAVAAAWNDGGRGNPHEQSAAMMKEGLLPPAKRFLGLRFWTDRQARSYTAAGSFVRFLEETYGMDKVRAAYARESFERTFGKSAAVLDDEWRAFLATIPVSASHAVAARERFTQPSLFERPCARELARLEEEGWSLLSRGRFIEANAVFERWKAIEEGPEPVRALYHSSRRAGDLARSEYASSRLLELELERSPMWWRAKLQLGEIEWQRGLDEHGEDSRARLSEAARTFDEVLEGASTSDLLREAWIKGESVRRALDGDRASSTAALALFDVRAERERQIAGLAAAAARSRGPALYVGAYLLGRQLLAAGDLGGAVEWLDRAAGETAVTGPPAAVGAELHALRGDALTRLGRLSDARIAWETVRAVPGAPREALSRSEDGLARITWLSSDGSAAEFRSKR